MKITHIFFDIGGVLGSNGWDREQRARARARFPLDEEFERRHQELVGEWENGRLSLEEYLESAVFFTPRPFTQEEFVEFMFAESQPDRQAIELARRLSMAGSARLFTLNNESAELNRYRIAHFGLDTIFSAFLSSCWLGIRKPSHLIFERALDIAGARPEHSLFIDDREQNLKPAGKLGIRTHHFTGHAQLERTLQELHLL